jgi:hypothetical protein
MVCGLFGLKKMFGALKKKFEKLIKADESKIVSASINTESIHTQVIDANQRQLYEQGIQADGTSTGDYALSTKAYKEAYGDAYGIPGRTDHITGLDTGETYKSMEVKALPEGIVITADNNGFFDREPKALGLTSESKKEIIPEIRRNIIEAIAATL